MSMKRLMMASVGAFGSALLATLFKVALGLPLAARRDGMAKQAAIVLSCSWWIYRWSRFESQPPRRAKSSYAVAIKVVCFFMISYFFERQWPRSSCRVSMMLLTRARAMPSPLSRAMACAFNEQLHRPRRLPMLRLKLLALVHALHTATLFARPAAFAAWPRHGRQWRRYEAIRHERRYRRSSSVRRWHFIGQSPIFTESPSRSPPRRYDHLCLLGIGEKCFACRRASSRAR